MGIMTLTWKRSKHIWNRDQKAFKELEKLKTGTHNHKLKKLYKKNWNKVVMFDEKLRLELEFSKGNDRKFIQEAAKLRFMDFTRLHIWIRPKEYRIWLHILYNFITNLAPLSVKSIRITSDSLCDTKHRFEIWNFLITPVAKESLELENMIIDNSLLSNVLQNSSWKQLIHDRCRILIDHKFSLDPWISYKIKQIQILEPEFKKPKLSSEYWLSFLAREISQTNLKADMTELVLRFWYPQK